MYISNRTITTSDVYGIVRNLHPKTQEEITALMGFDYENRLIKEIMRTKEKYIIRLKKNEEAVGIFGLIDFDTRVGGIFLLTTKNLHKGNIITFLKGAKAQIAKWEENHDLIMDRLYKENDTVKKWLKLLGFKPTNKYETRKFKIYYKGKIELC